MIRIISALMIAVIIAGCVSPEQAKPPYGFVAGRNVPVNTKLTVRGAEIIKVYKTGRYIDPANPNIMHEAGEIYVVNRSPVWNLRPNTPVNDPAFKSSSPPVNVHSENIKLLQNTNLAMRHLGNQMRENREKIQKISSDDKSPKNLQELIEKLSEEQGKIKRGLAELDK
jgi:hypothetical protein